MVSLNRRFHRIFALLLAVPITLAFLLLSWLSMKALLDTVSGQTQELMAQVSQTIENEVNAVSVLAATVAYDQELQDGASDWADSEVGPPRVAAGWRMSLRLGSIFTVANRSGAMAIAMTDGTILPVSNYPNLRSFVLADPEVYRQAKAHRNQVIIADSLSGVTENGGGRFILSAVISPSVSQGGRAIDAIMVMFRLPYLDQFTHHSDPTQDTGLLILGRDGRALLSNLPVRLDDADRMALRRLPEGNSEVALNGRPFLVNSRSVASAQWTLVLAMDKTLVTSRILGYFWFLYPVLLVIFALFLVYSRVFFSRVTRPIDEIMDNMRRFASGLNPLPVRLDGIVEMTALATNFDTMVAEIRHLEEERRIQTEHRLAAEIRALQFQINPHFVANTLNSIRMMALVARNDGIRDMTQALIRILADSYASTESLTDLGSEAENTKNYLFIMKVRFGEHFRVEWALDPDTLGCRVLRMGLQPLVENAVLHGFVGLPRQGVLTIRSYRDHEHLLIEVEDNGKGMAPAQVEALLGSTSAPGPAPGTPQDPQEPFHKIGIRNVHDRVRLNFGDGFGLQITSLPGMGTTVRMTLPFRIEV